MRAGDVVLACCVVGQAVAPMSARSAQVASPPQRPATEVSGVTVVARRATDLSGVTVTATACKSPPLTNEADAGPPHVVETYPVEGQVTPPGPLSIKVVFDQRMFPCSYSYEPRLPPALPELGARAPVLMADGRTFVVQVQVKANQSYGLRFNSASHAYFVSRAGKAAEPLELKFSTSGAAGS